MNVRRNALVVIIFCHVSDFNSNPQVIRKVYENLKIFFNFSAKAVNKRAAQAGQR